MNARLAFAVIAGSIAMSGLSGGAQQQATIDWPAVAGDVGGMKYSPANQITPANVATLKEAWTYQPGGPGPIVIGGVLKIAYDLVLYRSFRHVRPPEEQSRQAASGTVA